MLGNRPLIIACDGNGNTHLFTDGKVYGDGITDIMFETKHNKTLGKRDTSVKVTADDVNIPGSGETDDILAFRLMLDRIMKADNKENASANT